MENVVSEHGAVLCQLPCTVLVFEKNGLLWLGFKPALAMKGLLKHRASFPSSSSSPSPFPLNHRKRRDTHLTGRKFLQCKSLLVLPVSANALLFAAPLRAHINTHHVPICFAFPSAL